MKWCPSLVPPRRLVTIDRVAPLIFIIPHSNDFVTQSNPGLSTISRTDRCDCERQSIGLVARQGILGVGPRTPTIVAADAL